MNDSMNSSPEADETFVDASCPDHGPYKARVICLEFMEPGRTLTSGCQRCNEERRERERERERRHAEQQLAFKAARCRAESGVPGRFADATLESFKAETDAQQRNARIVARYIEKFDPSAGIGMLFLGLCGTGKTLLAAATVNAVTDRAMPAKYMRVTDAVRSIKATYSRDSKTTEIEAIAALVRPDLLVLDEVGVQFGTEHEMVLLFEIIDRRYAECRSTILVSNLSAKELEGYLGERVMDRFRETGAILPFEWESHRGRRAA